MMLSSYQMQNSFKLYLHLQLFILFLIFVLFHDVCSISYEEAGIVRVETGNCSDVSNYTWGVVHWTTGPQKLNIVKSYELEMHEEPNSNYQIKESSSDLTALPMNFTSLNKKRAYIVRIKTLFSNGSFVWSVFNRFVTCGMEDLKNECRCDPVGSVNRTGISCQPGVLKCVCLSQYTGSSCDTCVDGFYRPFDRYSSGCVACDCKQYSSTGVCQWDRHVGHYCVQCINGYSGPNCRTAPLPGNRVPFSVELALGIGFMFLLLIATACFVSFKQQVHKRAVRSARHSDAVQRLFSAYRRQPDDPETSAILTAMDEPVVTNGALQFSNHHDNSIYQPTTATLS